MTGVSQGEGNKNRLAAIFVGALTFACLIAVCAAVVPAEAGSRGTYISHREGRIVPIPRDIAHQDGSYIDRRLIGQLRYIDKRFGPIYITEGYAGPLRGRGVIGCPDCHVQNSDHFTALALDIAAPSGSTRCDRSWRRITALAKWAEPRQNVVRRPFRWVGYNGDAGHGCGHHLHLSWNSAPTRSFRVASWVELFRVRNMELAGSQLALRPSGGTEVPIGDDRVSSGGIGPS